MSKARLKNGTEIFTCLGDLTTYKVDAMVNAANEALHHGGGLARAIVQTGKFVFISSVVCYDALVLL